MPHTTGDLFDDTQGPSAWHAYLAAFESWRSQREHRGTFREASSVAVYRSMWTALAGWCTQRGVSLAALGPDQLEAYLMSRGGAEELSDRYAWRLLMLVDSVLAQTQPDAAPGRPTAARELLMARPGWRHANAADKTPLPEHLAAAEARRLVAWLLDPATAGVPAGAQGHSWQALRNRTAVALQLGAGLTPGDVRAASVDGVVCAGSRTASLPWKLQLPAHGAVAAREAPVSPWAGRLLRTWMDTRCALHIQGPALFPAARDGRAWGKVAQYNAARAVLAAAGVADAEGGSFKLRHTFALRQLRRGTPPEQVAQWMGLSDTAALARHRQVLFTPVEVV